MLQGANLMPALSTDRMIADNQSDAVDGIDAKSLNMTMGPNNELSQLRAEAIALAGRTCDLTQRASVYQHLYAHSQGNHAFPLLAAHGALWASGYFRSGIRFGSAIARLRALGGADYEQVMAGLHRFAEEFRDINRRVCVETYFIYWLTENSSLRIHAESIVPPELLHHMDRCHAARKLGRTLNDLEKRQLFSAFFNWEQTYIVGPSIVRAFAEFDWPLIKYLALRPRINFAYFKNRPLVFRDFSDTSERIENGLKAFDRACFTGWGDVEGALRARPQTS
jgi:hypothetical protein